MTNNSGYFGHLGAGEIPNRKTMRKNSLSTSRDSTTVMR